MSTITIISSISLLLIVTFFLLSRRYKRQRDNLQAKLSALTKENEGTKEAVKAKTDLVNKIDKVNTKTDKEIFEEWNGKR